MQYRPDIDGLRALAVLSVLFYHLGFSSFGGGYVGVDVFFVISGFLITQLIRNEVQTSGTFSFSNFYIRRVRRLGPALLFTFAVCFVCAVVLFSPGDLQRFSGALVHAVLSISNFYFWMESGYFDTETIVKPLLHTWSLSVEEQFYLIWPVTLVFLLTRTPRYTIPIVLVLAGLASLAINIDFYDGYSPIVQAIAPSLSSWFSDGSATIYFLAPFRVFEFAIGAGLVFLGERKATNQMVAEILSLLGLAMISFAVIFYTEETPFPTIYALLPCVGAALLIYFAGASRYCKLVLSHPRIVRLGLTSYSLYLIHWPIIVFFTYYTKVDLTIGQQWAIVLASIVAAELMFRWVETPFRNYAGATKKLPPRRFALASAMAALVIGGPAVSAWANQGWTWRFGQDEAVQAFGDIKELQQERADYIQRYQVEQLQQPETRRKIVVVGDSLGHDLLMGLGQNLGDAYKVQFERYNSLCYAIFLEDSDAHTKICADILAGLERSKSIPAADEVYIAYSMAPNFWATEFAPLIEYLQRRTKPGARIVLFGRRPSFPDFHSIAVSMLSEGKSIEQVEQRAREISGDLALLDRQMTATAEELGVEFISTFDMICSSDRCKIFTDDGSLLFWDKHHWTVQGATWFGSQVVASLSRTSEIVADAPQPVSDRSSQVVMTEAMTLEDAVEITRRYMSELSRIGIDSQTMYDISLLPDSKSRIASALLMMMEATREQGGNANYRTGIILLAHFQPNIGEATVGIDQLNPARQTWQELVDLDKQNLRRSLMESREAQLPQLPEPDHGPI